MNSLLVMSELEDGKNSLRDETPARGVIETRAKPKRVLIVDDDSLVRASLAAVLDVEGYEVYGAADGVEAIKIAIAYQPDLVLLDLNMPNMDGWTAFMELEDAHPMIPVIVLTARPHQYLNAVRLGVDAFMEKPLNIPVLLRAIRRLTHESEERHARRVTSPDFVTQRLDPA